MEIEYNIDRRKIKDSRGGWRNGGRPLSEEAQAILSFLKTENENIAFSYETADQARIKVETLRKTIRLKKIPVKIYRNRNKIFVEREIANG